MPDRPGPDGEMTHCEFCGAEYDADTVAVRPTHPELPVEEASPEPTTHCEFCGAEYPVPRETGDDALTE